MATMRIRSHCSKSGCLVCWIDRTFQYTITVLVIVLVSATMALAVSGLGLFLAFLIQEAL